MDRGFFFLYGLLVFIHISRAAAVCNYNEKSLPDGTCFKCPPCPAGTSVHPECKCLPCDDGYYSNKKDRLPCRQCSLAVCPKGKHVISKCTKTADVVCSECPLGSFEKSDGSCEECSPCCDGQYDLVMYGCYKAGMSTMCSCKKADSCVLRQKEKDECAIERAKYYSTPTPISTPIMTPSQDVSTNESTTENENGTLIEENGEIELRTEIDNDSNNNQMFHSYSAAIGVGFVLALMFTGIVGYLVYKHRKSLRCWSSPSTEAVPEIKGSQRNSQSSNSPLLNKEHPPPPPPPINPDFCDSCSCHIENCHCLLLNKKESDSFTDSVSEGPTYLSDDSHGIDIPESTKMPSCIVDIHDEDQKTSVGYENPLSHLQEHRNQHPDVNCKLKVEKNEIQKRPYNPSGRELPNSTLPSQNQAYDNQHDPVDQAHGPVSCVPYPVSSAASGDSSIYQDVPATPNNSLTASVMVSDLSDAGENKPEMDVCTSDLSKMDANSYPINHDVDMNISPAQVANPENSYGENKEEQYICSYHTSYPSTSTQVSDPSFVGGNKPEPVPLSNDDDPKSEFLLPPKRPLAKDENFSNLPEKHDNIQYPSISTQVSDTSLVGAKKPESDLLPSPSSLPLLTDEKSSESKDDICTSSKQQVNIPVKFSNFNNLSKFEQNNIEKKLQNIDLQSNKDTNIKPEDDNYSSQMDSPDFNHEAKTIGSSVQEEKMSKGIQAKHPSIDGKYLKDMCSCLKKDLKVLDSEVPGGHNWKELATKLSIKSTTISHFENENKKLGGSATCLLLEFIPTGTPTYSIGDLKKDLKEIQRLDVVEIIIDHPKNCVTGKAQV